MAVLLLSCDKIQIKNSEWLGSKGPLGAVDFHTLSREKSSLSMAQFLTLWNNLKHPDGPMICTHSKTFADLKKLWEECVTNGACEYASDEQKAQVNGFLKNIEAVGN